jgi:inorganic phosphate transporter, PiT family
VKYYLFFVMKRLLGYPVFFMITFIIVTAVIILIIFFAYTNGKLDVGNIIATMISSGAMSARQAMLLVVFFEFLGPLIGGTMVANAVASLVRIDSIKILLGSDLVIIVVGSGILAAISWNLITLSIGLPSSSSHSMFGGLMGATLLATLDPSMIFWGFKNFRWTELRGFAGIAAALFFSPLLGFVLGYLIAKIMSFILRRSPPKAGKVLRQGQIITASALAFGHGTNAAQKSMGLIVLVLIAGGYLSGFHVPFWVKLSCAAAITCGVLSGGWKVMKTVGRGIFNLRLEHGFEAQLTSALIIIGNSFAGGPVSTTHIISTSVMGVGTSTRKKAVRWRKVIEILTAWIITLPASVMLGATIYMISWTIYVVIKYS